MARTRFLVALVGGLMVATPALAQFNTIFGEPIRPPGEIPGRNTGRPQQQQQQVPTQQQQFPVQQQPTNQPQTGTSTIQTQPLPPVGTNQQQNGAARQQVPGTTNPTTTTTTLPGLQPGQRQPRGTPQDANVQPGDEVVTELPSQKIINPTAVFSGLDKITGRILPFDVAINETVQFGALQVTPRACYTRPPTETPNTDAFIEVDEITLQGEVRRIFTGWMFASSPGLHAVEHPIYDVWLVDCKKDNTGVVAGTKQTTPPQTTTTVTPTTTAPTVTPRR